MTRRICLTPVRNEAWILDRFLAAARQWATDVVVADQGSSDGTLEQLRRTTGVSVVINDSPSYDETHRQRLLLTRARQIEGKRVLIALDADEALSANFAASEEWGKVVNAAPGTILRFRWVNILPGFDRAWIPPDHVAFGFVDDGSDHRGQRIHNPRLPQPEGAPVLDLNEIVVLHFQYVAWERMVSKHRWYQAWEHVTHQEKGPLQIFREYRHMYGSWTPEEIHPVDPLWLDGYDRAGIDFRSLAGEPVTWWDTEVLAMLEQYGPERFRKIDIWDKDWNELAARTTTSGRDLSDPRSWFEKRAHKLLMGSQGRRSHVAVRALERLLRHAGW